MLRNWLPTRPTPPAGTHNAEVRHECRCLRHAACCPHGNQASDCKLCIAALRFQGWHHGWRPCCGCAGKLEALTQDFGLSHFGCARKGCPSVCGRCHCVQTMGLSLPSPPAELSLAVVHVSTGILFSGDTGFTNGSLYSIWFTLDGSTGPQRSFRVYRENLL